MGTILSFYNLIIKDKYLNFKCHCINEKIKAYYIVGVCN